MQHLLFMCLNFTPTFNNITRYVTNFNAQLFHNRYGWHIYSKKTNLLENFRYIANSKKWSRYLENFR